MTKHATTPAATVAPAKSSASTNSSEGTIHEKSQIKQQGEVYKGKKTYFIKGDSIGREDQEKNERLDKDGKTTVYPTQDLKNNGGQNGDQNNKFQDDGKCFSWEGSLVWSSWGENVGCTEWKEWKNKVEVGQMYGMSPNNKGFKKLKGISRLNQQFQKYHFYL